ncbi:hypothetical protein Hanom_Chr04g00311971 [Helianthus anomalus]
MYHSTAQIVIPAADPQPPTIKLCTFFTAAYLIVFECIRHIFTVASIALHGRLVAPLRHLWAHYYRQVVFGGEGVAMPHSALAFIINALLALAEIKSQGLPGFPFQTHPLLIMFSVTCLLIYGLASAAELVVSSAAGGLDPTSVYAVTAHLAKIGSLLILVASLASLFYI